MRIALLLGCGMVLLGQNQPWKDKKVPNWTEDDAKIVMLESPWAKSVMPDVKQQAAPMQRQGGGMGRGGVRVGGMGIPTGGRRGGGYPRGGGGGRRQAEAPSALVIRWESALPMREAELKARDTSAPTIGEDHYTLAVYGLPRGVVKPDDKGFVKELAKKAALKRDGKKDLKPASVRVLMRDDGPVVVYLFSRTTELTKNDRRIEFSGEVGTWKFATPFFTDDMVFDGKLEL